MVLWFRDVISEGTYNGDHTKEVQRGFVIGFLLFIISEIFAFLSVFWAFFHSSLSASIAIGGVWPPAGITPLDPYSIPMLNTFLLVSSGGFITYGHHALMQGKRKDALWGVIITIILAIIFTGLQYYEYSGCSFTMADSIYGSLFFASTGLHGIHCSNWNTFAVGGVLSDNKLPCYRYTPSGFGSCNNLLTLCRCSMNFFVFNSILLKFCIKTKIKQMTAFTITIISIMIMIMTMIIKISYTNFNYSIN